MKTEIILPEGVSAEIIDNGIKFKGPKGEIDWQNPIFGLKWDINDGRIILEHEELMYLNTAKALVEAKIYGVQNGYWKKMVVRYSHFPIKVKVQGNEVIIENFYGEKAPRKAKIVGNTKVEVKGQELLVSGIDKYEVAQTAANIREATKLHGRRRKDIRKMQDGIYVSEVSEGYR